MAELEEVAGEVDEIPFALGGAAVGTSCEPIASILARLVELLLEPDGVRAATSGRVRK